MNKNIKNIIVTGSAGFIGSAVCTKLLEKGNSVLGIDNHNDYYDPKIKDARLDKLEKYSNYKHFKLDLTDAKNLEKIFKEFKPQKVINLAAQAGVRYSIKNPIAYINSNIVGFANILENCRHYDIEHLVYASTSSVYGANTKMPFSEHDSANHPLSVYAASKKSNELMAHTYSYLYKLPTTGLRFFTVYGPWGSPDMALFNFTDAIINDKEINIFNYGKMIRDFTYIDDVVDSIEKIIFKVLKKNQENFDCKIYNIGSENPVTLMNYINEIEMVLKKKAKLNFKPLQPGDVLRTSSNSNSLYNWINFKPKRKLNYGIKKFVEWYIKYNNS